MSLREVLGKNSLNFAELSALLIEKPGEGDGSIRGR